MLGEQRCDLRHREHEHEVPEELDRTGETIVTGEISGTRSGIGLVRDRSG
jgi:capsular polysaccharide biosynthesis protein